MKGKDFAELTLQYLKISKLTLEGNIERGNLNSFFASNLPEEEFNKQSDNAMKYNDNNVGIALLFNFYHGIELLLKTVYKINSVNSGRTHSLVDLYNGIKIHLDINVKKIIESYLLIKENNNIDLLNRFFIENNSTVDNFYILLRYPEGKKEFNYENITWQEEKIIPLYTCMKDDIDKLIIYIVEYTKKNP